MKKLRVWIDDERPVPMDYDICCSTAPIAIKFIEKHWGLIEHISLDHDLGSESDLTGYDVVKFIEQKVHLWKWEPRFTMGVHSDNPVGRKNMNAGIESIFRKL